MKKNQNSKLQLNLETIQTLQEEKVLEQVAGGDTYQVCITGLCDVNYSNARNCGR